MSTPKRPTNVEQIQCEVCLKEIPKSEAKSAEADEYVMYFCGLECYDRWRAGAAAEEQKGKK
jgi:hypothetical protein